MPVTDVEQLLREAVASVIATNATVQAAVGRTTDVIRQRSPSIAEDTPLPIVLYDLQQYDDQHCEATLLLSVMAETGDAAATCRAVMRAAVDALDWAAFHALGIEIVPRAERRQSLESSADVPGHVNRDGQPFLQQVDAIVPLLYLP